MKMIKNPKMIPSTKVGVNSDLLLESEGNDGVTRAGRRRLATQAEGREVQQAWYTDSEKDEQISLDILDALEIKFVSDDLDLEEGSTVQQSIEWDLIDFSQDFIKVQLKFEEPEEIGGLQKKDYIQFTFWGVELFQD